MHRPNERQTDPDSSLTPGPGPWPPPEDPATLPAGRQRALLLIVAAVVLVAGAFVVAGCDADPVEEVDVADVTEEDGPASAPPEDEAVTLSGNVVEILTETALTVTDEQSAEPLLVLLPPTAMVNGTTWTLGAQPGLAQIIPPEATLQLFGTIETFDSAELAERLGIVLNEELFAPWEGESVLIAQQVDTFDPEGDVAAETSPVAE